MTFIKNNGFYMKILWYILKFPEISGELSGELQPAKKFSSPTPAKSDFLLSAEISGDLLETEISTTLKKRQKKAEKRHEKEKIIKKILKKWLKLGVNYQKNVLCNF